MWHRLDGAEFYQQSAREAEEDRQAILQQQIEERRYYEEEQRARDLYTEQVIEQNAIIQREKLRQEFEEEQEARRIKDEYLGQRRDAHVAKLEALARQVEEEKRNKFAIVQQNREKKANLVPIPVIRVESAHDKTPVGGKKPKKEVGDSKKKPKKSRSDKKNSSSKGDSSKSEKLPKTSSSKSDTSEVSPNKLPEVFHSPKFDSRRNEIDRMRYDHTNPNQVVHFERDGKRRRMPSKKADDFGLNLDAAAKAGSVKKEDASNFYLDNDDRRRKLRNLSDKRFKKNDIGKLGPQTPPLPPISGRHSSATSSGEEISTQTENDDERMYFRRPPKSKKRFDPPRPKPSFDDDDDDDDDDEDDDDADDEYHNFRQEPVRGKSKRKPRPKSAGHERPLPRSPPPPNTPPPPRTPPPHLSPRELHRSPPPPRSTTSPKKQPPPPPKTPPSRKSPPISPTPFDWGIEFQGADDDEVSQVKKEAKKDTEEFAKKNEGIFSQLHALRRRLKNYEAGLANQSIVLLKIMAPKG